MLKYSKIGSFFLFTMVALQANIYFTSCIDNQSSGCINSPGESSEDAVKALSGSLLSQPRPSGSAHDPEEKADFDVPTEQNKNSSSCQKLLLKGLLLRYQ